jgi:HSP20 family protein
MKLTTWDPFRDLDEMVGRYSPSFRAGLLRQIKEGAKDFTWSPAADITETPTEYLVKADLPGVDKKDVHLTVENGQLRITGERTTAKEAKDENEIRIERFHGTFSRTFALPDDADATHIRADSSNGALTVHIPKSKGAKAVKIDVPIK